MCDGAHKRNRRSTHSLAYEADEVPGETVMTDTTLTMDQVRAAQANDLAATAAVVEATESRVKRLAEKAARRMSNGGDTYMNAREEFEQVGRIAVWESLPRFTGDSVDVFMGFIYATAEAALLDAVREERHGGAGVDPDAMKIFASMLEMADGDVYLAEKLSQTVPPKGRRLSADRANAARMAWQGSASLDAPTMSPDGLRRTTNTPPVLRLRETRVRR